MDEEIVSSEDEIKQQIPRKLYLRVNKFNQGNMLQSHKFFEVRFQFQKTMDNSVSLRA